MIDFVQSTHDMFSVIEKRFNAMEEKLIRLACDAGGGRRDQDEAAKRDPQHRARRDPDPRAGSVHRE